MTCSTLEEILEHAVFLARHFRRSDLSAVVTAILMELKVPTNCIGYYYLKDAIILSYTRPAWAISRGFYFEVAKMHGAGITSEQVEQAIRSAIEGAWKEREEERWRHYFNPDRNGKLRKPKSVVFITRIGRFLELWQGCCREVSYEL